MKQNKRRNQKTKKKETADSLFRHWPHLAAASVTGHHVGFRVPRFLCVQRGVAKSSLSAECQYSWKNGSLVLLYYIPDLLMDFPCKLPLPSLTWLVKSLDRWAPLGQLSRPRGEDVRVHLLVYFVTAWASFRPL
uniref:Uncharacterized protein n=1 Tax=Molossus molossus TaxID=27622 RepID=A0A7J8ER70_MOLMO|nr:hypothetical protein HJG59_008640 [Molossus molossus]